MSSGELAALPKREALALMREMLRPRILAQHCAKDAALFLKSPILI
jgi:hypothetical protein